MSFEIYTPEKKSAVAAGAARLDKNGILRVSGRDLRAAGIPLEQGTPVTLLVDAATRRVAVRKSRPGEPSVILAVGKTKTSGWVLLRGLLKTAGWVAPAGSYEVTVKDELVVVLLGNAAKAAVPALTVRSRAVAK